VKTQGQLYASAYLAVGVDAAATLRQAHDRTDRFAELWTREYTVKMYRKALVAAKVQESLLLESVGVVCCSFPFGVHSRIRYCAPAISHMLVMVASSMDMLSRLGRSSLIA